MCTKGQNRVRRPHEKSTQEHVRIISLIIQTRNSSGKCTSVYFIFYCVRILAESRTSRFSFIDMPCENHMKSKRLSTLPRRGVWERQVSGFRVRKAHVKSTNLRTKVTVGNLVIGVGCAILPCPNFYGSNVFFLYLRCRKPANTQFCVWTWCVQMCGCDSVLITWLHLS